MVLAREILAGKLSNPDVHVERIVELLDVVNHYLRVDGVNVKSSSIDRAASAGAEEIMHPLDTRRTIGACGRDESVTFILEWLNILLPQLGTILRGHVRLAKFIWLVHSKDLCGITLLDQFLEIVYLLSTPQHGNEFITQRLSPGNFPSTPCVVPGDLGAFESLEDTKIRKRSGNSNLTAAAGWGRGGWRRCLHRSGGGSVRRGMRSRRTGFAAPRIIGTFVEGYGIMMCMTGQMNTRIKRNGVDGR